MKRKEFISLANNYYFGGKSASGTYQTIINQLPVHDNFVSGFLGYCGITRLKRPAKFNIGIEMNSSVIEEWNNGVYHTDELTPSSMVVLKTDFLKLNLPCFYQKSTLLYLDPPYVHSTRRSSHKYNYELTYEQHKQLLKKILHLNCNIALSCYDNPLYAEVLADWRKIDFEVVTRGGTMATETLYMNYPEVPPSQLHDKRFIGDNYRSREVTKKRLNTIFRKIERLESSEKGLFFDELKNKYPLVF